MDRKKKTTLEQIARKVNCSKSVVSRALNNKYGVSDETKNRIFVAAMEMGYEFDRVYTAHHRSGRSDIGYISVVLPKVNLLDDKFYGQMVCGIEEVLNQQNVNFCLNMVETMNRHDIIDTLHRTNVSGVIVLGLVSYESVAEIIGSGLPVVLLDTLFNHLRVDRLTINNYSGAVEATEHLLQCGHRNIAFFGDVSFSPNFAERYRGMYDTCKAFGESVRTDCSVISPSQDARDVMANVKEMRALLARPDRPTAVLCATDQIGFRLYELAKEAGLSVPQQLSVIGFGNNEQCKWVTPAMTSVDIPQFMLGKEAANILLKRIKHKDLTPALVQLDSSLYTRDSVTDLTKKEKVL